MFQYFSPKESVCLLEAPCYPNQSETQAIHPFVVEPYPRRSTWVTWRQWLFCSVIWVKKLRSVIL